MKKGGERVCVFPWHAAAGLERACLSWQSKAQLKEPKRSENISHTASCQTSLSRAKQAMHASTTDDIFIAHCWLRAPRTGRPDSDLSAGRQQHRHYWLLWLLIGNHLLRSACHARRPRFYTLAGLPPLKRRTHVKVIFHTVSGQLCFRNSWHSGWLPRLKTLVIILTPPSSKFHHPGWTKRWYVASTVHAYVLRGVILPFDRDRQFFVVSRSEAADQSKPHETSIQKNINIHAMAHPHLRNDPNAEIRRPVEKSPPSFPLQIWLPEH
jgi:hypothetical protein